MKKIFAAILVAPLLAGCGHSSGGSGAVAPAALNAGVVAECQLLQKAFVSAGKSDLTIVSGCPGHENAPRSANQFEETARFARAVGAPIPAHVKAGGDTATRIFQRMISRGTPVDIATKLSASPAFKAAVAAQQ